jgi:two-component sensor histidine kinase/HAMP domain-containing protein
VLYLKAMPHTSPRAGRGFFAGSIRNRLILASAAISLAACLAFAVLSYILSSRESYAALETKTGATATRLALSLSQSIWQYDIEGSRAIMASELADPEILGLALRDEAGGLVAGMEGRPAEAAPSEARAAVALDEEGLGAMAGRAYAVETAVVAHAGRSIATVRVFSTDRKVRGEIASRTLAILGDSIVIGILVALAILLIFDRLVSERLVGIGRAAERFAGGDFSSRAEASSEDEIGALASSFNGMAGKLEALYGELQESDRTLRASLAEKELLLREVHHRVKNNLQVIASLLSMQSDRMQDEGSRWLAEEAVNRIVAMAQIHDLLYESANFAAIDFSEYVRAIADDLRLSEASARREIALEIDAESIMLPIDLAVPCGLILNELLTNSLLHAFPDGRATGAILAIGFHRMGEDGVELVVADNGRGISEDGGSGKEGYAGLSLVRLLALQIGGDLSFGPFRPEGGGDSGTGKAGGPGTRVRLDFTLKGCG